MTQIAKHTFITAFALLVTAITFHAALTVPVQPAFVPFVLA